MSEVDRVKIMYGPVVSKAYNSVVDALHEACIGKLKVSQIYDTLMLLGTMCEAAVKELEAQGVTTSLFDPRPDDKPPAPAPEPVVESDPDAN